MNSKTLKILISLFAINSITLFLYFSSHLPHFRRRSSPENSHAWPEYHKHFSFSVNSNVKPWPILPSYLPWSQNPNVPVRSCEAYFGNGFTRRFDLVSSSEQETHRKSKLSGGRGWFRCMYSESLESSVCEGGRIRMHPEKIKMSDGGERLENVIGRGEDEELPEFEFGAFDVEVGEKSRNGEKLVNRQLLNQFMSPGAISRHTMRNLIDSIRLVAGSEFHCSEESPVVSWDLQGMSVEGFDRRKCSTYGNILSFIQMLPPWGNESPIFIFVDFFPRISSSLQWVEEPTLLVTRFEYANLFHTITDWYSAYVASRVTGLPYRPHVVFVDGHCMAPLEETWKEMFSSLRYAKNFSGPVCFRHAIISPLGYETVLFKGLMGNIDCHGASAHDLWQQPDDRKTARISEFGEMIRASFGFPVDRHHISKPVSGHNVLFVRREDYLAHPRHGGKVQSRLSNEQEVFDSIKSWVSKHAECKINLINGIFAHMPMKEQVRAIQDASVIIGAHGAGLTHIVSATPETVVLEIISPDFMRPHFALIAKWKGLDYHSIYLDASSYAKPAVVIDKLSGILRSLGC